MKIPILGLFSLFSLALSAQDQFINVDESNPPNTSLLSPGTRQYLVYIQKPDGSMMDISIWERTVNVTTYNNQPAIEISQSWKNQNNEKSKKLYSLNRLTDFQPIYHYTKSGKGKVQAFNFSREQVQGADSVPDNELATFNMDLEFPVLNFELDMEVLRMLAYKENATMVIPFYHPGNTKAPREWHFKVEGRDQVRTSLGAIACWKVSVHYADNNAATFWISEDTHEFIRMEETFGKIRRYKVLL